MTLQLYQISKNDAKKNPAEDFQRDVENNKVIIRIDKEFLQFLPATDTESYGIGCHIKSFLPHILKGIASVQFYGA
jgi:hypothetical protein